MKKISVIFILLLTCIINLYAQNEIPLYKGKAPGSERWSWKEKYVGDGIVYDVSNPTLTVFYPKEANANGTAIIICPGGAFHMLNIDNEGYKVAEWLSKRGITAFVLKYRLVHPKEEGWNNIWSTLRQKMKARDKNLLTAENDTVVSFAIADGKKAIEYVRSNANFYHLNTKRIGIIGFSAGGTVALGVGISNNQMTRPDFIGSLYSSVESLHNPIIPADAPPLFICVASDDNLDMAPQSINLYNMWWNIGRNVEMHVYAKGSHGFGMSQRNLPVTSWIDRFYDWLKYLGYMSIVNK